jgi:hypothetical protein
LDHGNKLPELLKNRRLGGEGDVVDRWWGAVGRCTILLWGDMGGCILELGGGRNWRWSS